MADSVTMYIIKSGNQRFARGSGCGSGNRFSESMTLLTATKFNKQESALMLINERIQRFEQSCAAHSAPVALLGMSVEDPSYQSTLQRVQDNRAKGLKVSQDALEVWAKAVVVPVTLTEP